MVCCRDGADGRTDQPGEPGGCGKVTSLPGPFTMEAKPERIR